MMNPEEYENPFRKSRYKQSSHYRNERILFAGLARDIQDKIEKSIMNCVLLGTFFREYKVIIFENDSKDTTRNKIEEMCRVNKNIHLIECEGNKRCEFRECPLYDYGIMNPNRIDRMVYFRNVYLGIVNEKYRDYDYLCVIDFDIDGDVSISGLLHSLDCPLEWSCICANGRSGIPGTFGLLDTMYDAMALCLTEEDILQSKRDNRTMTHLVSKYLRLIHLSLFGNGIDDGFIPILSAFNGFAIYKLKDVLDIYYNTGYTCEHISLHDQLVHSNKKILIDLHLKIYVGHQGPRKIADFFR